MYYPTHPPTKLSGPPSIPQGTPVLEIKARDGDLGEPRPLTLTLQDDDSGYFTLADIRTLPDGSLIATLATSAVTLDREDPLILNNGGLYTFSIRVSPLLGFLRFELEYLDWGYHYCYY